MRSRRVTAAVLVEVVRQPVRGSGSASAGAASGRGRMRVSGPRAPLHGAGGVGQRLLQPVLAGSVPLRIGQVAGAAASRNACGMARAHAQAAGVHRRVDQRPRGGRGVAVPGQQLRRPGQELGHPAVLGALRRPRPARIRRPAQLPQSAEVKAAGTGMSCPASSSRACACGSSPPAGRAVSCPSTAATAWPAPAPGARAGSRSSSRSPAATRSPSPPSAAEVLLGLVQPHHRPRPDTAAGRRSAASGRDGLIGCHSRHPGTCRAAVPAPPSRPGSCPSTNRPPAPRSVLGPASGRPTRRASAASCSRGTYGGSAGRPGAARLAGPAGAPPGRTGPSPHPAATPAARPARGSGSPGRRGRPAFRALGPLVLRLPRSRCHHPSARG